MSAADSSPASDERQSAPVDPGGEAPPRPLAGERRVGDRRVADRRGSGAVPGFASTRPPLIRGISLYAALFAGVLVLLLVTLVLEDNALREAYRAEAQGDASSTATIVETSVLRRIAALQALQGLVDVDPAPGVGTRPIGPLLTALAGTTVPLVDRVLLADSAGTILRDTSLVEAQFTVSAAELRALARADTNGRRRRPFVVALREPRGAVALVVPLSVDTTRVAVAVGIVRAQSLLRRAIAEGPERRRLLVVRSGPDTILRTGDGEEGPSRRASAQVTLAGGARWQVDVTHEDTAPGLRTTLWLLGGSALFFLLLGFARERRRAEEVADRSAELERLSSELLRSNRMKSEFLANISHELRTPLNAIVGFVELLKDGVYGELSPRQINPVDRIAGSASHLRHLVDQVLDIAKMAAGRLEVHLEPIVLRPFVLNVASELESLAADKGIVLSLTVGAALPRVRTDPSHLRQILVNLLGNAIKYTPSGGAVGIRTRIVGVPRGTVVRAPTPPAGTPLPRPMTNPQGTRAVDDEVASAALAARSPDPARPWILIQVSDTGIGVAPEDHERIFEEFEQVDAGPRAESMHRGTGLGLPISRRLARLLGGDVTVESTLGKGATFTLWLPVDLTTVS